MNGPTSSYLLVTPVHNEGGHLNRVLDCVERQTLPPLLWVVVDDASTDNSGEILRTAQLRIGNLCVLRLPEAIYEAGTRYAAVCRKGFEHGLMLLNADGCCPAYVGLLDGDILLPDDYFERLVNRFGRDPSAGIMSGVVDSWYRGKFRAVRTRSDWPGGCARLWSIGCFTETGGYELTPSPDSVANVRAHYMGFVLRKWDDLRVTQVRLTGGATGLWRYHSGDGRVAHFFGTNPLLAFGRSVTSNMEPPYYAGWAFLWGFICARFQGNPRSQDSVIRDYYGRRRLREALSAVVRWPLRRARGANGRNS